MRKSSRESVDSTRTCYSHFDKIPEEDMHDRRRLCRAGQGRGPGRHDEPAEPRPAAGGTHRRRRSAARPRGPARPRRGCPARRRDRQRARPPRREEAAAARRGRVRVDRLARGQDPRRLERQGARRRAAARDLGRGAPDQRCRRGPGRQRSHRRSRSPPARPGQGDRRHRRATARQVCRGSRREPGRSAKARCAAPSPPACSSRTIR